MTKIITNTELYLLKSIEFQYVKEKKTIKIIHEESTTKVIRIKNRAVAEFKEFERRFKFKPRFKYGWFHLKLYQMFQDLSLRLI